MRRTTFLWLTLCTLLLTRIASAQPAELDLWPASQDQHWAGEQVTIYLELKTPGQSFSDVFFDLPAVEGAFLLRPDSNTIKGSENRGAETWQILRYPLALFAPRGGSVLVPAFEVRFKTSGGFGTEPTTHALTTPALQLAISQPPGTEAGDLVIASPSLSLEYEWSIPPAPIKPGDALTLTVERSAAQLSAMLLPPLPLFEAEGLAAYPAEAQLEDRSNRGQLVGERTDEITWIIEQPGTYTIPAVRFRWWDPAREALQDELVEGLTLDVPAAAGAASQSPVPTGTERPAGKLLAALILLLLAGGALGLLLRFRGGQLLQFARRLRRRILPPARGLLKQLNPE